MTTPKPQHPTTAQIELAADIDELGALEAELAPINPKLKRVEVLRSRIRARYHFDPALAAFEAKGERYAAMIGARGSQTVIDLAKLAKAIGSKALLKIATVTMTALEAHVAPDVVLTVASKTASGPRSLKVYPLAR